jgi:hypothetical protein
VVHLDAAHDGLSRFGVRDRRDVVLDEYRNARPHATTTACSSPNSSLHQISAAAAPVNELQSGAAIYETTSEVADFTF